MDQGQFTTTFIPKKPLGATPTGGGVPVSRPVGLLSTISTVLFFLTIAIAAGVYFYHQYETRNVAVLGESVERVQKAFEPQLITQLQSLDQQLRNANTLVRNHTVVSPVFSLLESSTLRQVKFSKFDFTLDESGNALVKMSGEADNYRSIAQQSDLLGANSFLKDAIFSNFFLTSTGRISFDLSFGMRPEFLDFEKAPIAGDPATATTN